MAAGIPGFMVNLDDLRHTMRTNDLPTLQKLLGHSTPMLTLHYAHLSKGPLASEIAVFESAMPSDPELHLGCTERATARL